MLNGLIGGARANARRIEALERELEALKARSASEAARFDELSRSVGSLAERLSTLAGELSPLARRLEDDREEFVRMRTSILSVVAGEVERARELAKTVAELSRVGGPDAWAALEERAKDDQENTVKMRTAILRLERQLDLYAEETRKTGVGLLERLEMMRPEGPPTPA